MIPSTVPAWVLPGEAMPAPCSIGTPSKPIWAALWVVAVALGVVAVALDLEVEDEAAGLLLEDEPLPHPASSSAPLSSARTCDLKIIRSKR